jgi:hypothetical protein
MMVLPLAEIATEEPKFPSTLVADPPAMAVPPSPDGATELPCSGPGPSTSLPTSGGLSCVNCARAGCHGHSSAADSSAAVNCDDSVGRSRPRARHGWTTVSGYPNNRGMLPRIGSMSSSRPRGTPPEKRPGPLVGDAPAQPSLKTFAAS